MNFIEEVDAGMRGKNQGIPIELSRISKFINNLQRRTYYLIGAPPKCGKTSFVDKLFVIDPYKEYLAGKNIKVLYFSYEIPLVDKMAKFAAYYMYSEYGILDDKGEPYPMEYILGRGSYMLTPEHREIVQKIYDNQLTGIFGKEGADGKRTGGMVEFHEDVQNPTGIRNEVIAFAGTRGKFIVEPYKQKIHNDDGTTEIREKTKIVGYKPNDENEMVFVIVDHLGRMAKEKGGDEKSNIDKMSSSFVWIRNLTGYSPVAVQQIGRNMSAIERLKFQGEELQPTRDDFKGSGNPIEDCNMAMSLFNPSMHSHIHRHLDYDLDILRGEYRSFHLLESRNTESGVAVPLYFVGQTGLFMELPKANKFPHVVEKIYRGRNIHERIELLKSVDKDLI